MDTLLVDWMLLEQAHSVHRGDQALHSHNGRKRWPEESERKCGIGNVVALVAYRYNGIHAMLDQCLAQ